MSCHVTSRHVTSRHVASHTIPSHQIMLLVRKHPCKHYALITPDDPATLERGLDFNDERILAVLQHTQIRPVSENNMLPMPSRRQFKGSGHPRHDSRPPLPHEAYGRLLTIPTALETLVYYTLLILIQREGGRERGSKGGRESFQWSFRTAEWPVGRGT
eukprot:scaffold129380_cov17-Prasinocladus_malaysianus.AAC.1